MYTLAVREMDSVAAVRLTVDRFQKNQLCHVSRSEEAEPRSGSDTSALYFVSYMDSKSLLVSTQRTLGKWYKLIISQRLAFAPVAGGTVSDFGLQARARDQDRTCSDVEITIFLSHIFSL